MRYPLPCTLAALVFISCTALTAQAADRGQALYEMGCDACHDKSVHQRSARHAASLEEIRNYVTRWSAALGTGWRDEEIDQVTDYLNQRYYHYPCASQRCQAGVGRGG